MARKNVDDILRKYGGKIESSVASFNKEGEYSREYLQFKKELRPDLTTYEKWAKGIGEKINLKIKKTDEERLQKDINVAHLDITPSDAAAFSMFLFIGIVAISLLFVGGLYLLGVGVNMLVPLLLVFIAAFAYYYANQIPSNMAQKWRLQASSQMVPAILYIIIFMKHTSNLERALKFASNHLQPPLAYDFKKILWDVETGKFSSVKASLDAYLEKWKDYSLEFVESFHLVEGSLYEPIEARRIVMLEKALSVMLDGVYNKMIKFTHNVQSPLTNLYMLGIVLPTLAIALLPLVSTLLGGSLQWWHVALLFNMLVPFFVYYYANNILSNRPGGYGETNLLELNPDYKYFKSKKHATSALWIVIPLIVIGLIPFIFQFTAFPDMMGLQKDYTFEAIGLSFFEDMKFFGFMTTNEGVTVGPFGVIALLLSLLIPLGIASFFFLSYRSRTSKLIKLRDKTKQLEGEFSSSLFHLGNRLGDGIPAEIAFGRVAESLKGTPTYGFFSMVNSNIAQFGMSVRKAIFDKRRGAIIFFPSDLVRTSMEILIESVKKGLTVSANALMSISEYLKNIKKINERLRDLLAEITSSMKSNMSFLAPLLAGIVVGLSAMITSILMRLQILLGTPGGAGTQIAGIGSVETLTKLFDLTSMIPPYFIQIIVGIYVVEIIYILTVTLVTVENGVDPLGEKYEIAKNMLRGIMVYLLTTIVSIIGLSMLAVVAIGGL